MRLVVDPSTPPAVRARSSFYILSLAKESLATEGEELARRQLGRKSAEIESQRVTLDQFTDGELDQLEALYAAAAARQAPQ